MTVNKSGYKPNTLSIVFSLVPDLGYFAQERQLRKALQQPTDTKRESDTVVLWLVGCLPQELVASLIMSFIFHHHLPFTVVLSLKRKSRQSHSLVKEDRSTPSPPPHTRTSPPRIRTSCCWRSRTCPSFLLTSSNTGNPRGR